MKALMDDKRAASLPWRLKIDEDSDYLDGILCRHIVQNEAGNVIAYCFDEKQGCLIAAAPDLLAALKELVEHEEPGALFSARIQAALAAIAKAEGSQ